MGSKLLALGVAGTLLLSSCSLLPQGTPTVAICSIPPTPELPPREGDRVVLEVEHMTDLLIYFDSVESCLRKLQSD